VAQGQAHGSACPTPSSLLSFAVLCILHVQVWIWATALTYLIWRFKWRRDRRMAAEQFAQEQQQEEDLRQEWYSFAQSYGVKTPPPNSNS
jgi:hypothetical protein